MRRALKRNENKNLRTPEGLVEQRRQRPETQNALDIQFGRATSQSIITNVTTKTIKGMRITSSGGELAALAFLEDAAPPRHVARPSLFFRGH
jgi:hypothetical protein